MTRAIDDSSIYRAILDADRACPTIDAMAVALHAPASTLRLRCEELERQGLVSIWRRPDADAVTLSPLTARRLDVTLVEAWGRSSTIWVASSHPLTRRCPRSRLTGASELLPAVADSAEPDPIPPASTGRPRRLAALPRVLLGLDLSPWPGPSRLAPGTPCPACAGGVLGDGQYCLYCDRSGADRDQPGRSPALRRPAESPEAARALRDRRKQRRRARRTGA